ncbi:hypothetical protein CBL_02542 [Carabus blaptoides fortunei]
MNFKRADTTCHEHHTHSTLLLIAAIARSKIRITITFLLYFPPNNNYESIYFRKTEACYH